MGSDEFCVECGGKRFGYYRCRTCKEEFTVRTGTLLERSHVPLNKWLYVIYILITARNGISSPQFSKELSVTEPTACFMLGRLREACSGDLGKLCGVVEVDETFVGGKSKNMHTSNRLNGGRDTVGKTPVVGARQRNGKIGAKAKPVTETDTVSL